MKSFVHAQVHKIGYTTSVDVLLQLGYLTKEALESWRFGKTAYLEQVCTTNLSKLTTINKIIRKTARELQLTGSFTSYLTYGKGPRRQLRFSISGDIKIEEAYATHFVNRQLIAEIKAAKQSPRDATPARVQNAGKNDNDLPF